MQWLGEKELMYLVVSFSGGGKMNKSFNEFAYRFLDLCHENGFSKDSAWVAGVIAGSKQMHSNYGTTEEAFQKLIEFTKEAATEEEVLEKIEALASYKRAEI